VSIQDSIVRRKDHVKELNSTEVNSLTTLYFTLVTTLRLKVFWI
jgi:hypothetical protein